MSPHIKIRSLAPILATLIGTAFVFSAPEQVPAVPDKAALGAPFDHKNDTALFASPPRVHFPQTWFHFIGDNVSRAGITADLEAIATTGISGVQLFHGQFGGRWPGNDEHVACLSPEWDATVRFTAEECRRLGLRFTMQNCPGWSMAGGPWITHDTAQRKLVYSISEIGGAVEKHALPKPGGEDFREIAVLAFPTPSGWETPENSTARTVKIERLTTYELTGDATFAIAKNSPFSLKNGTVATSGLPAGKWLFDIHFPAGTTLRSLEMTGVEALDHGWAYEPGVSLHIEKIASPDGMGASETLVKTDLPQSSWQDNKPLTLALPETTLANSAFLRVSIENKHHAKLGFIRFLAAARPNNWEAEAGWTLRGKITPPGLRSNDTAAVAPEKILDISGSLKNGQLSWTPPAGGTWTILRFGHVNAGERNGPAPKEGTGWECDKLSTRGPDAHFAGYIGRLTQNGTGENTAAGPLAGGLLHGMLLDSWECHTQTWTDGFEGEFTARARYALRPWLPAVAGFVVGDHERTTCFLLDFRRVVGALLSENFYGRMAELVHSRGLDIAYETAAGDVVPADILEYFKHADVPMAEFWQPITKSHVGSINFKPIKPAASAAHVYGKPRVAAEAFTSFALTFDEHFDMLKEVANQNTAEGVTHCVFHTYTHNPQVGWKQPGTSFGSGIGTPFLRGQTWWNSAMPEFTAYLARLSFMLERGRPVADVLWYLGDEISHKPDQDAPFPRGFKYDYCNPDVLLNRLAVSPENGNLITPDGVEYRVLWLADTKRMLPETLEKIARLAEQGAAIVGEPPVSLATLQRGPDAQKRFDAAVGKIWNANRANVLRQSLGDALRNLKIRPDVTTPDGTADGYAPAPSTSGVRWLHRRADGADWWFVTPSRDASFKGELGFRVENGTAVSAELWDPVTGATTPAKFRGTDDGRICVALDLPRAGAVFVVLRHTTTGAAASAKPASIANAARVPLTRWTLAFPAGWGAPDSLEIDALKPWKELPLGDEGRHFSGTATYTTTFELGSDTASASRVTLDLGRVDMIAEVFVNDQKVRTLWAPPYTADLTKFVRGGENDLRIEVTSTWFNRLTYDARLPEEQRKTWTISGPGGKNAPRDSGLLGPVQIIAEVLFPSRLPL